MAIELTTTQRIILEDLIAGKKPLAICADLGMQPKTYSTHAASIMNRLKAETMIQAAVVYALARGKHVVD